MYIEVLKSKLHRVKVTQANLNYIGSITIDEDLMDAANLIAGEKVQIMDNDNGERFETYVIKGERGSGCICLNGAAARRVVVGDTIIIVSYALMDFEEAKTSPLWSSPRTTASDPLGGLSSAPEAASDGLAIANHGPGAGKALPRPQPSR